MLEHFPRPPLALDPLIAEAKRRMHRRRLLLGLVAIGVFASTIGLTLTLRAGGPENQPRGRIGSGLTQQVNVSPDGQIGPLQIDHSTRSDVIAFAGRPAAETTQGYANYVRFDALGYGCPGRFATNGQGLPECKTVYYVNGQTGRLTLVFTSDPRYVYRGVHSGTVETVAEHDLHTSPGIGCYAGFAFGPGSPGAGTLIMELFTPTGSAPNSAAALRKSHVAFLAVQSARPGARNQNNPGVLDCIDR